MSARSAVALACLLALAVPARAGRPCEQKPLSALATRKGFALAKATLETLEKSGEQVALLARVGSDASEYGIRFTHIGFVWRDHPEGRWRVVHLLNTCGTDQSKLYTEGLANFYLDELFAWEGRIIFPSKALQTALADLFQSGEAADLHQPKYNLVAYPFSEKYQNCTAWTLEVLARAMAGPNHRRREDVQQWLKSNGFTPTTMKLGALKRLGARMTQANMAFDDHPDDRRFSAQIDVVTVAAIEAFLAGKSALAGKPLTLAVQD